MRLATVQDVRNRQKTLLEKDSVNDAIGNALDSATLYLEGALRTTFAKETLTHTYYVDTVVNPRTGPFTEVYLNKGFVTSDPLTVKIASRFEDFPTESALTLTTEFTVDRTKGIVFIPGVNSGRFQGNIISSFSSLSASPNQFLAEVQYTAGFDTETDDIFLYLQTQVPSWLKEAAVVYALIVIKTQSPTIRTRDGVKLDEVTKRLLAHVNVLVDTHARNYGSAIKPMF